MNIDRFKKISTLLNLGNLISRPTKVTGGLLHLMWHLKTSKGQYAVKQLNKNIVVDDQIKISYEITERIALSFFENGITAAVSLNFNNKSIFELDDNIFIVYPWIDGVTVNLNVITHHHAKKIGAVLARMHMLSLRFPELSNPKWEINTNEYFCELTDKIIKNNLPFAKTLKENLSNIISWNDAYQKFIPSLNYNLVVSHGDLDSKNVIWKNDLTPMLIDWESARLLNPTQEILNAALDWSGITSGEINLIIFKAILSEYKIMGGNIIKDQIHAAFWAIVGNWLNWMRFNIERALGKHISTEEERDLGIKEVQKVLNMLNYLTANINNFTILINEL